MRRWLIVLFAALGLAAAVHAAPRDWTRVAVRLPLGTVAIGNPAAKVKLVEYLSYSCPHCAHFATESGPTLRAMIRSGSLRYEIRNQIHDKLDLTATLLVRCVPLPAYADTGDAVFAQQATWMQRAIDFDGVNATRIALYPVPARLKAYADASGLTQAMAGRGLDDAAVAACLASDAGLADATRISASTEAVAQGTPTFEINGRVIRNTAWSALEPMLRAAGAK